MADIETLGAGAGLAQGFEKAVTNIFNIKIAKQKMEREQKKDELDNKIKNLQLDKLEDELDPETMALHREALKEEVKAKKSLHNLNMLKIGQEHTKVKREAENHAFALDFMDMAKNDPEVRKRMSVDSTGAWKYAGGKDTFTNDQVLKQAKIIAEGNKVGYAPVSQSEIEAAIPDARALLSKAGGGEGGTPAAKPGPGDIGGVGIQQPPAAAGGGGLPAGLPSPADYEDGSEGELDGITYKIVNGAWARK